MFLQRVYSFGLLALILFSPPAASAATRQVLHGHVPSAAVRLQPVGRVPVSDRLDLEIALPLRNQDTLTNLLQQIYDPASPNYHQYLTPAQFAAQFGPTQKDYEQVIAFAKSKGLSVSGTHPNRTLLDVNGSVSDIEKAFHLTLRTYQHPKEARKFRSPDTDPSLDLAVPVLSIGGLDDFVVPHPMSLRTNASQLISAVAGHSAPYVAGRILSVPPNASERTPLPIPLPFGRGEGEGPEKQDAPYAAGSGPAADFMGRDFRAAYAPGVALDGSGQSVGLFELDGYFPSDITTYENVAGLPNVPLTNVLVGGAGGGAGANNIEVALDIDMVVSMAPGLSQVIVYEGTTPNATLNRMATDNVARQLSSSWGFGAQVDPAREQIFQQYAAQGQSMFQASGDFGAWAGAITPPSADPYLTVVGGTSLTTSSPGGPWSSETTWSGSGGGISPTVPIPSWQQGINMSTNLGSTTLRNIPDVACLSDVIIFLVANNGLQTRVGGTSAAAPLWAAFTALANQQGAITGKPALGFLNPALYSIGKGPAFAASFHDITTGNNTNSSSTNKFFARAGYDLCTGWGTPAGSNLINNLFAPPDALRITPEASLIASGPAGGPFGPLPQSWLLTNIGTTPLGWTLVTTSQWLNVSPTSGMITNGKPATAVSVTAAPSASNLLAGTYTASLTFNNLNNNVTQTRQFTLAVVNQPAITSQPANQAVMEGATASFSVGTASNPLLFYQWRYDNGMFLANLADGGNISGSGTSTLTVSNASSGNVGAYSVIVSNAAGAVTSSNAFLTIVPWRPVIVAQPTNQTVLPGQTVAFSVAAVGSQPLSYRWQKNGTNLTDGGDLTGSTLPTLTLANASPPSAGTYSVNISNALGSATSTGAVLTVVSLTTPGTAISTLYSFTGGSDGANPNALMQGTNGILYGTTQNGGAGSSGTVFQMGPGATPTNLYSFTGLADGGKPFAGLAQGGDGNFYGSTYQGGASNVGSLFKITPVGTLDTLRSLYTPDGVIPYATLLPGADGSFYGSGYEGGTGSSGTLFKLTPDGAFSVLFPFAGGGGGSFIYGALVQDTDGTLYGTTYAGGTSGFGTVFRVTTNGALTTLASFNGTNGAAPYAGLVKGSDGNFYGATFSGGSLGNGTLFRITPAGLITNLYSFTGGADGRGPAASLIQGDDGNFYGTTAYGGAYNDGTVFRLAPNGAMATIAQFDGFNGANPFATLCQAADGNLYGTTQNGGSSGRGAIFRISISGAPQITAQPIDRFAFTGENATFSVAAIGSFPLLYQWQKNGTNLSDGGNLSGSANRDLILTNVTFANAGTYSVIVSNALGWLASTGAVLTVTSSPPIITLQPTNRTLAPGGTATFVVTAIGTMPLAYQWQKNGTNLADSANLSGAATAALTITSVLEPDSGFYSLLVTNSLGSITSSVAVLTVIPVSAAGTRLATLHAFTTDEGGGTPNGLVQGADGNLYGTTQSGGTNHLGSAFSLTTNGIFTTLFSFFSTNGTVPLAAPVQAADGNLYGTTEFGGVSNSGTVFKLNPGGVFASLYSFSGSPDGAHPFASLVPAADGTLYGQTTDGGVPGFGEVFKITTNGEITSLYSFTNGVDGASPAAALVLARDGNFYGMTGAGAHGFGNIFRMTPSGALSTIYAFTGGFDGSAPAGSLVQGSDGLLYGVTKHNVIQGLQFYGTIFSITTNGVLSTLYPLNAGDGHVPYAGLVEGSGGILYGTTYQGGSANNGTVYGITPNGSIATLASFDGFDDGAHPQAALIEGADGSLYGTTTSGGPGGNGTVFRLSVTSAPQIIMQPANQVVSVGASPVFSVAVFGQPPLFYQWRINGTNLTDNATVSGSSSRILALNNVSAANAGTYSVVVSNALGSVPSAGAVLTVRFAPVFQASAKTNGAFKLTWSAASGLKYQLQYKPDLRSVNWSNLGNAITATNASVNASDPIGSNSQRFYRVILLP